MEQTSNQKIEDQLTYTVTQETEDQRTYTVSQETDDQRTYTVSQETEDQRTYTVEPETKVKFQRKISVISTVPTVLDPELISVCACLYNNGDSVEDTTVSKRKRRILSHCARIETYLRERRIPELIRFITTKIMCSKPHNVAEYAADLLDQCMMFRSGHGQAPVLFEERHLEAVVKSFDPCNRGWLSAGQVRRAFTTLGLTPKSNLEVKTSTREVLEILRETQELELLRLLSAGSETEDEFYGN